MKEMERKLVEDKERQRKEQGKEICCIGKATQKRGCFYKKYHKKKKKSKPKEKV